jgi:hypothetical protein
VPHWQIDGGNLLVCGSARLALQRIGLAFWQPGVTLRSWGVAPLHGEGTRLYVPCADNEALWLGLWSEGEPRAAEVQLLDPPSTAEATARTGPGRAVITALNGAPLARTGSHDRVFVLHVQAGADQAQGELHLLAPVGWARRAGRPPPAALTGPPTLPRRLG